MRRRHRLLLVVAGALVLGGCSSGWDGAPWAGPLPAAGEINALRNVDDCAALAAAARPAMLDVVASMWSEPDRGLLGRFAAGGDDSSSGQPDLAEDAGATAPAAGVARSADASTIIGTNSQERDVAESDLVATDGTRIVSVVGTTLRVTQLDGTPAVDGRLDLSTEGAAELFLRGETALVLGTTTGSSTSANEPGPGGPVTTLTLVSLADPSAPSVMSTVRLDGTLVTAREVDGQARVVVQQDPGVLDQLHSSASRDDAVDLVDAVEAADLLPEMEQDGDSRPLGGCGDVLVAAGSAAGRVATDRVSTGRGAAVDAVGPATAPAGLSTVTVLSVGDDLDELHPVSVQGAAETVYASTEALFIASSGWDEAGSRTDVHRLALDGDGPATYTGSGRVPGHLLDQFALSERDGALRVVTTLDGADGANGGLSSARLTVLDTDGSLDEIGHVGDMGIGEQVHSVRFLEDLAYVVTFRQVDPLYAIDLSDARSPRVLGELKIPGFSEYLHPLGDGLLLGVGREVDPTTGVDQGLKISLFDVADPLQMAERDQIVVADGWSAVSDDHQAFTWDPVRRRAILPVERACGGGGPVPVPGRGPAPGPDRPGASSVAPCTPAGASMVIEVADGALSTVAEIGHAAPWDGSTTTAPLRSLIVDDDLWTVSLAGLGRSDVGAPAQVELIRH